MGLEGIHPGVSGVVLAERFEVLRELERSAAGCLFLARDLPTRQLLLVETAHDATQGAGAHARLQREAGILARLDHPSILRTAGIESGPQGIDLLRFEPFAGEPLDEVAARWHRTTASGWSTFPLKQAVHVAIALCEAIHHAHERGVVHGMLRPTCVLLAPTGEIRIAGWVAARLLDPERPTPEGRPPASELGDCAPCVGTYLAPELGRSGAPRPSPVSDVFGIGAILFHLLTGAAPPVRGGNQTSLGNPKGDDLAMSRPHYQTPSALRSVCLRAIEPQPERRYQCPAELAADLRACLAGRRGEACGWSPLSALAACAERHPLGARVTWTLLLITAGSLVVASALARREQVFEDWTRIVASERLERVRARVERARQVEVEGVDRRGHQTEQARQLYLDLLVQFAVLSAAGGRSHPDQVRSALARPHLEPVRMQLEQALWGLARTTPATFPAGGPAPSLQEVLAILERIEESSEPVRAALAAWSRADAAAMSALLERADASGWSHATAERVTDAARALGLAEPAAQLRQRVGEAR